jgi:hypothetical protein
MLDTWVVFLLGNALVVGGLYITYLLREIKLHRNDVDQLVAVLQMVEAQVINTKEDADATRH